MEQMFPEWVEAHRIIELIKVAEVDRDKASSNPEAHLSTSYTILNDVDAFTITRHRRVREIERSIADQEVIIFQHNAAFKARFLAQGHRVDQLTPGMDWEVDSEVETGCRHFDDEYMSGTDMARMALQLLYQKKELEEYLACNIRKAMESYVKKEGLDELENAHWHRSLGLMVFRADASMIDKKSKMLEALGGSKQTPATSGADDARAFKASDNKRHVAPLNCHADIPTTKFTHATQAEENALNTGHEKQAQQEPCSLCGWLNHTPQTCWKVRTGQVKTANQNGNGTLSILNSSSPSRPSKDNLTTTCSHCHKPGHHISTCWELYPSQRPAHMIETTRSGWAKPIGKRNAHYNFHVDERTRDEKDRARRKAGWKEKWIQGVRGVEIGGSEEGSWDGIVRWGIEGA